VIAINWSVEVSFFQFVLQVCFAEAGEFADVHVFKGNEKIMFHGSRRWHQ
jgi:hypothetical protein